MQRAAHVGWLRIRGERYRSSWRERVWTVLRSAGACHIELGDNGKSRGQCKVCGRVRALHGCCNLSGFGCFTGGIGLDLYSERRIGDSSDAASAGTSAGSTVSRSKNGIGFDPERRLDRGQLRCSLRRVGRVVAKQPCRGLCCAQTWINGLKIKNGIGLDRQWKLFLGQLRCSLCGVGRAMATQPRQSLFRAQTWIDGLKVKNGIGLDGKRRLDWGQLR